MSAPGTWRRSITNPTGSSIAASAAAVWLYEWKKAVIVDPPAIAAKLEELARGRVGLTPHSSAIARWPRCGRK
jgi:hypothetical protein